MAIYFKKLRWKNFISTGNLFTEIDLTRNKSTLIVGENGAGKSTILDALLFSLYGKPFRNINKPQLVNSITQKNLLVEVEFSVGRSEYLIRRGLKPGIFEIYQNGTLMNQDSATRDYQEYLEKNILKLNHKSFNQIVVLGSANFIPFMQLPAGTRRQVIEDLLDIQIFSTMNTILKEKVQLNKEDLVSISFEMKSISDKIEMHKKHLETIRISNDEVVKQKEIQLNGIIESKNQAAIEIQKYEILNTTAELSISDKEKIQKKYEQLEDLRRKVGVKLVKLKKDVKFFEDNNDCPTCKQGIQDGHKHEIIDKNNKQIKDIEDGTDLLQQEFNSAMDRIAAIQVINKSITENNKKISELNTKITMWNNFENDLRKEIIKLQQTVSHNDDSNVDLQALKTELKESIVKKEDLSKEKQILDVASSLLKDGGIKTRIIRQYIPIINQLINKYLSAMDFFVNFELNENFEETIKSRFRDEFSYASFSEGEKMRIDLALLFAWRAVAKLRNSSTTNLLIMDEVFDSSLDSGGTDEFIKILNGLAQDTNVFIISHKGDQLYDKFHSVIKFEKHKNFSRISI
ncbi:Phage recombination-related endonuclease Gp46 [uncultured phage]|nr:Phage recombination-related endonuclease Gp46 [uncultured phage]